MFRLIPYPSYTQTYSRSSIVRMGVQCLSCSYASCAVRSKQVFLNVGRVMKANSVTVKCQTNWFRWKDACARQQWKMIQMQYWQDACWLPLISSSCHPCYQRQCHGISTEKSICGLARTSWITNRSHADMLFHTRTFHLKYMPCFVSRIFGIKSVRIIQMAWRLENLIKRIYFFFSRSLNLCNAVRHENHLFFFFWFVKWSEEKMEN